MKVPTILALSAVLACSTVQATVYSQEALDELHKYSGKTLDCLNWGIYACNYVGDNGEALTYLSVLDVQNQKDDTLMIEFRFALASCLDCQVMVGNTAYVYCPPDGKNSIGYSGTDGF